MAQRAALREIGIGLALGLTVGFGFKASVGGSADRAAFYAKLNKEEAAQDAQFSAVAKTVEESRRAVLNAAPTVASLATAGGEE